MTAAPGSSISETRRPSDRLPGGMDAHARPTSSQTGSAPAGSSRRDLFTPARAGCPSRGGPRSRPSPCRRRVTPARPVLRRPCLSGGRRPSPCPRFDRRHATARRPVPARAGQGFSSRPSPRGRRRGLKTTSSGGPFPVFIRSPDVEPGVSPRTPIALPASFGMISHIIDPPEHGEPLRLRGTCGSPMPQAAESKRPRVAGFGGSGKQRGGRRELMTWGFSLVKWWQAVTISPGLETMLHSPENPVVSFSCLSCGALQVESTIIRRVGALHLESTGCCRSPCFPHVSPMFGKHGGARENSAGTDVGA